MRATQLRIFWTSSHSPSERPRAGPAGEPDAAVSCRQWSQALQFPWLKASPKYPRIFRRRHSAGVGVADHAADLGQLVLPAAAQGGVVENQRVGGDALGGEAHPGVRDSARRAVAGLEIRHQLQVAGSRPATGWRRPAAWRCCRVPGGAAATTAEISVPCGPAAADNS